MPNATQGNISLYATGNPYRMKDILESKWKMIFVPVLIEDKNNIFLDLNFLFDTGAAKTEISHETAIKLGFSAKDGIAKTSITTMAGKIEGYQLILPEIKVFNQTFKNFKIGVFDIAVTKDNNDEIDGIIGMDIISQFKLLIDGPNKRVRVQ